MRLLALPAMLVPTLMLSTGCAHEGPAQRAGEKVDRALDDVKK